MASAFISIPTKKAWDVDLIKPIREFLLDAYTDLTPSDYEYALTEFNKLRSNAVSTLAEINDSSLDLLCRYYDQLSAIDGKLPIVENQIRIGFKWQDAITKKIRVVASNAFEKGSVLFSIAAMQTQLAESQSLLTDEGLKTAARLFQQSSGIFAHLLTTIPTNMPGITVCDLHPDVLNALCSLTLAGAQECFVRKAVNDKMKANNIAKLSFQCALLYTDTIKLMQAESTKGFWPKDYIQSVTFHQDICLAVAQFHQSVVDREAKKFGEYIARLRIARDYVSSVEKRGGSATAGQLYSEFHKTISLALQQAEKDNGLIYHLRVPDATSLPAIEKAVVAKSTPMSAPLNSSFTDLFNKVVPMVVRNAVASFEMRKSEIMFSEVGRLREATQALNTLMVTFNLPAALEDLTGDRVPQSLISKAATVRSLGGIEFLSRVSGELIQLLHKNKSTVEQSERELMEEEASDRQLRAHFGPMWVHTPSEALNAPIREELAKYRTIINNAIGADALLQQRFTTHRNAITLLSQTDTDIERSLPSGNPVYALQGSPVVASLRQQVDEVQSIKEGRDKIEQQLKDVKCDVAGSFLTALMQDGSLKEAALSSEYLNRVYGPLREQVAQSLKRQDTVVKQLQQSYAEFSRAKTQNQSGLAREKQLKDLAMAYDSFMDLKSNIEEGISFYNDLTQMLTKFYHKVSAFCAARQFEKDELMKDLSGSVPPPRQPFPPTSMSPGLMQSHSLSMPPQNCSHVFVGNNVSTVQIGNQASYGGHSSSTFFTPAMPRSFNPYAQRF